MTWVAWGRTDVHSKIRRSEIRVTAADINRLGPHESPDTDVILLGHSMGGILAAEVTLMPSVTDDTRKLRHRVIGTINFDTPFLGIHPGVVASGLGSLFRPAPGSPKPEPATTNLAQQPASFNQQAQPGEDSFIPNSDGSSTTLPVPQSTTPLTSPPLSPYLCTPIDDPNYDPPFPNDNLLTPRLGWSNALHFINKHSDGLVRATKTYVTSHLEFGFALVDHKTLKPRYRTIRKLEDGTKVGRVRFVNYYTACTGRPKKSKDDKEQTQPERIVGELDACVENANLEDANERSRSTTPRVSVDVGSVDHRTLTEEKQPVANINTASNVSDLVESIGQNAPIPCNVENAEDRPLQNKDASQGEESLANSSGQSLASYLMDNGLSLPPIPASPPEPPRFTCESNDKELRRIAEQQYKRDVKAYRRAQKDRHKAVSDRRKYLEKREKEDVKRDKKERLKAGKNETKEKAAMTDEESSRKDAGASPTPTTSTASSETGHDQGRKPPRDKRFCLLPSKVNGLPDPCWERVFMPDVDEVGAHCGLFFMDGDRYEWFVGDVSQRIVDWVREA